VLLSLSVWNREKLAAHTGSYACCSYGPTGQDLVSIPTGSRQATATRKKKSPLWFSLNWADGLWLIVASWLSLGENEGPQV
jgi:hypothetical protein